MNNCCYSSGEFDGLLLGDRGNPCQRHLLTPEPDPHPGSRSTLMWPTAGTEPPCGYDHKLCWRHLRVTPEKACEIIVARVGLQNIGMIEESSTLTCKVKTLIKIPSTQQISRTAEH